MSFYCIIYKLNTNLLFYQASRRIFCLAIHGKAGPVARLPFTDELLAMSQSSALAPLNINGRDLRYVPIADIPGIDTLPYSLRVLLENLCRQKTVRGADVDEEIRSLLER